MDDLKDRIRLFLEEAGWGEAERMPLAGDASARCYERLVLGTRRAILMICPPDIADIGPFVRIDRHLRACGLSAPEIYATDAQAGLIAMEDLGDAVFARWIENAPQDEARLYAAAVDILVAIQRSAPPADLVHYNPKTMSEFIAPVFEFYCTTVVPDSQKQEILAELETVLTELAPNCGCLALRDFHAENLIWLPDRPGVRAVGILDFQDAVAGHRSYDLVSLLQDARRNVSPDCVRQMVARFSAAVGADQDMLVAEMAAQGAQRALRILGIFARLAQVADKPQYLRLIPRVWGQLQDNLNHPALSNLNGALKGVLPEPDAHHLKQLTQT